MNQATTLEPSANETAEMQAGVIQCLAEIERIQDQMRRDQVEIDRSRTRTHTLLADLRAALSSGRKAA